TSAILWLRFYTTKTNPDTGSRRANGIKRGARTCGRWWQWSPNAGDSSMRAATLAALAGARSVPSARRCLCVLLLRPRIAPQRLDPRGDGGMRSEQAGEAPRHRVLDEERLQAGGHVEAGVPLDLAEGADQGVGVLGELRRPGVGQELARARQREADQRGDPP